MKYLGEHLDIHCAASTTLSPRHTNEIAQSERTWAPLVQIWVHIHT